MNQNSMGIKMVILKDTNYFDSKDLEILTEFVDGNYFFVRNRHLKSAELALYVIKDLRENITKLTNDINSRCLENKNLKDTVDTLNKKIDDLSDKNTSQAVLMKNLYAENSDLESANTVHNNTIESYDKTVAKLEKDLTEAEVYKTKYYELLTKLEQLTKE